MTTSPSMRVLLVDDEPSIRLVFDRMLTRAGFTVRTAADVADARRWLDGEQFDVIVTDINLPGTSGVELLAELRTRDRDLPVVLMTGGPRLETAMRALNLGAYRYLPKPIDASELERVVRQACFERSLALLKQKAVEVIGAEDRARIETDTQLNQCIDALWMAWQPIVRDDGAGLVGYEALLRTDGAGLTRPDQLIDAAQRLGRGHELARAVRRYVAAHCGQLMPGTSAYMNLLPADLTDADLLDANAPLSAVADRVTLELTERATLQSVPELSDRVKDLRALGYRIAIDDLGAGYSGLSSITQLEPDVIKLDMSLIRGIHESRPRQAVVKSMVDLCRAMNVSVIAEGIEEQAEADAVRDLGIEHLQGYLFGRPQREMRWSPRTTA